MIAPQDIDFYDSKWNYIGQKLDLVGDLTTITGIGVDILLHKQPLNLVSVAARMSWAAKRETTRTEDIAYCLFGIFDVNFPLVYGEAEKAFQRLQEEIIRSKADLSILAWQCPRPRLRHVDRWTLTGVLAQSPADFYNGGIVKRKYMSEVHEFAYTNVGIRTRLRNLRALHCSYALQLNCYSAITGKRLAIRLRKVGPEQYLRSGPYDLLEYATSAFEERRPVERYLLTTIPSIPGVTDSLDTLARFQNADKLLSFLRLCPVRIKLPPKVKLVRMWPADRWDEQDWLFFVSGDPRWDSFQMDLRYKLTYVAESANGTATAKTATLDFTLYALGWSHTRFGATSPASFGLISRQEYQETVDRVHQWILQEEPTTAAMYRMFTTVELPKLQLIRYDLPQSSRTLVVKIEDTLNNRVTITAEEVPSKDVPKQVAQRWPEFRDYKIPARL